MTPINYGQFHNLATKDDVRSAEERIHRKIEEVVDTIHELFLLSQEGAAPAADGDSGQ